MLLSRTESLLPRPKLYRNMIRNFNHQKWQKIITAYHRQVGRHVRSLTNFLHDLLCNPYTIPTEKWQFAAVLPFLTQKTLRASFGVNIQDIHCQKPTYVVKRCCFRVWRSPDKSHNALRNQPLFHLFAGALSCIFCGSWYWTAEVSSCFFHSCIKMCDVTSCSLHFTLNQDTFDGSRPSEITAAVEVQ